MATNITGVGVITARSAGQLIPLRASKVSIAEEISSETVQGYPDGDVGILQVRDTKQLATTTTISLETGSYDEPLGDFLANQLTAIIATIPVPIVKVVTVPATPFAVTETGLTVDQLVDATILNDTSAGNIRMVQVTGATAIATNNYKVSANTITFHATDEGKKVLIYYQKTQTSLSSRGGTSATAGFTDLELFFKYKTTRNAAARSRWYPKISPSQGFTFDPTGDSFTKEFIASLPSGWNHVYLDGVW